MNSLFSVPASLRAYQANVERRWQGSVAQGVWQRWLAELRGCVPARWRHRLRPQVAVQTHRWLIVTPTPEIQASARHVLMLPTAVVMIHRLQLPTAAARDLTARRRLTPHMPPGFAEWSRRPPAALFAAALHGHTCATYRLQQ